MRINDRQLPLGQRREGREQRKIYKVLRVCWSVCLYHWEFIPTPFFASRHVWARYRFLTFLLSPLILLNLSLDILRLSLALASASTSWRNFEYSIRIHQRRVCDSVAQSSCPRGKSCSPLQGAPELRPCVTGCPSPCAGTWTPLSFLSSSALRRQARAARACSESLNLVLLLPSIFFTLAIPHSRHTSRLCCTSTVFLNSVCAIRPIAERSCPSSTRFSNAAVRSSIFFLQSRPIQTNHVISPPSRILIFPS